MKISYYWLKLGNLLVNWKSKTTNLELDIIGFSLADTITELETRSETVLGTFHVSETVDS